MAVEAPSAPIAGTKGGVTYEYFRLPNGEVQAADCLKGNSEKYKHLNEGWVALPYGRFEWGHYQAAHPYEGLILRGGAKELSVKHLVEMGFHHSPPIIPTCRMVVDQGPHKSHHPGCWQGAQPAHFPQLDGLDLPPAALCDFCDDGLKYPTSRARDQHLRVMHKDELAQVRMGGEIARGLADVLRKMGVQVQPFACGLCQEAFTDLEGLASHAAKHSDASTKEDTRGNKRG